jgi:hypothetical protein
MKAPTGRLRNFTLSPLSLKVLVVSVTNQASPETPVGVALLVDTEGACETHQTWCAHLESGLEGSEVIHQATVRAQAMVSGGGEGVARAHVRR